MEYLRSEICQLGGLVERKVGYRRCTLHEARVIVVHSVYVGPDLDFLGSYGRADKGGGVVASATLEIVHVTEGVAADEALGDVDLMSLIGFKYPADILLDEHLVRLAVLVCLHEIQCRKKH